MQMQFYRSIAAIFLLAFTIQEPCLAKKKSEKKNMSNHPVAVLETSMGTIEVELFQKDAPKTVQNFMDLAKGTKEWTNPKTGKPAEKGASLYKGTIFHRVIEGFMIQGGDPAGNGTGGPGYNFEDETKSTDNFAKEGLLAMANRGPNTNGSQFFITLAATPWLNGRHTIFGQVSKGMDVVHKIAKVEKLPGDRPAKDIVLQSVTIK